jgi:parallel beta-helix repeat protein
VQRSNIIIDGAGFSLQGEGEVGIDLTSVGGVTIQNLDLLGGFNYGIYMTGSSMNTLVDNTISGNGIGLRAYNSSQLTLTGNTIEDNNMGIELWLTSQNVLRNNVLDNFRNFAIYATQLSHYNQDIDDSNLIGSEGKKIYYLIGEQNLVLTPETFDAGFVALVSCQNITVQGQKPLMRVLWLL